MDDNGKFHEGNNAPEENQAHTRAGIMLALEPLIKAALCNIPGLNILKPAHLRRTARALATISVRLMMDAGATPQDAFMQLAESFANECKERNINIKPDLKKNSGGGLLN